MRIWHLYQRLPPSWLPYTLIDCSRARHHWYMASVIINLGSMKQNRDLKNNYFRSFFHDFKCMQHWRPTGESSCCLYRSYYPTSPHGILTLLSRWRQLWTYPKCPYHATDICALTVWSSLVHPTWYLTTLYSKLFLWKPAEMHLFKAFFPSLSDSAIGARTSRFWVQNLSIEHRLPGTEWKVSVASDNR